MTAIEQALLPLVQAKHPGTKFITMPLGNGYDTWIRAHKDWHGFIVVYLWEVVPRNRWHEFNLTTSAFHQDSTPHTV